VGTGRIKLQARFHFVGRQSTNVDLPPSRSFDGLIELKTRIHRPDPHDVARYSGFKIGVNLMRVSTGLSIAGVPTSG